MTSVKQYRLLGSTPNRDEATEPIEEETETEHAMAPNSNPVRQRRTGFIHHSAGKDEKVKLGVPDHEGFGTFSGGGNSELRIETPSEDSFLNFKTDKPPAHTEFISKDAGNSIVEVNPPSKDSSTEFTTKDAADSIIEVDEAANPAEPVKVGFPPPKEPFYDTPVATEFISKDAADSIIEVDEETQFQAPVALMGLKGSKSKSTESRKYHMDKIAFEYFGVGAMVGIGLAVMIAFRIGCRRRRFLRERKRRRTFNHYDDTIKFRDECDSVDEWGSTDESTAYDPEGIHYMKRHPVSFDSTDTDWLGGIGFANGDDEGSYIDENMNDLDESSCYSSDYSTESSTDCQSDGNNSLQDLLNNESSSADEGVFSLNSNDLPSMSPEVKRPTVPQLFQVLSPQVKRPTVPQLFQDTLSSHWKQAKQGLLPLTSDNEDSNNNTFCELQQEQEELNKFIFTLNDSILERQRDLNAAAKTLTQKITRRKHKEAFVQHKKIYQEINRLEEEKEDVDAKLKTVLTKIKGHRMERRRRLFLEDE